MKPLTPFPAVSHPPRPAAPSGARPVVTPADLRLIGLAMICPAVTFTVAAAFTYPPAALTLAPAAATLCALGAAALVASSSLFRRD